MAEKSELELAAAIYGCKAEEIISYRLMDNGFISIIAPTGQKFVYSDEQLEAKREALKPSRKPKAAAPRRQSRASTKKK
jgi:hypothetical protein